MSEYEIPDPDFTTDGGSECYYSSTLKSEIKNAEKRGEERAKNLGECDECGTPYSFDPTDGGTICVRCLTEKLNQARDEIENLKKNE
jgi:hypothetical protein